ncbi:transcriptional regulator ATRX homolog isoform X4 [Aethina tumida]|uniref:transcriptional regulator ATRX homolog isoform X4 n=1 Tax=Aethina tumida TaxID=116153 RepID=UPI002147DC02|nr:transcriptional regulator ATRX homolog isoform X4 [Aethina tumida]
MSTQSEEKAICDALKILFDIKNTGNEMKEKAEKLMMNIKISEMKSLPKEMIYIILHSHCNLSKLYHRTLEIVKCLMSVCEITIKTEYYLPCDLPLSGKMDICKNSNNFTNVSNAEMSAVELNKPVNEKEIDNNKTLLKDNSSFTESEIEDNEIDSILSEKKSVDEKQITSESPTKTSNNDLVNSVEECQSEQNDSDHKINTDPPSDSSADITVEYDEVFDKETIILGPPEDNMSDLENLSEEPTALTVEDDGLKPERHADLKVADKTTIAQDVSSFTKDSLLEPRTDLEIADKTIDNLHVPVATNCDIPSFNETQTHPHSTDVDGNPECDNNTNSKEIADLNLNDDEDSDSSLAFDMSLYKTIGGKVSEPYCEEHKQPPASSDVPESDNNPKIILTKENEPSCQEHNQPTVSSVTPESDKMEIEPSCQEHNQPTVSSVTPEFDKMEIEPICEEHNQPTVSSDTSASDNKEIEPSCQEHNQPTVSSVTPESDKMEIEPICEEHNQPTVSSDTSASDNKEIGKVSELNCQEHNLPTASSDTPESENNNSITTTKEIENVSEPSNNRNVTSTEEIGENIQQPDTEYIQENESDPYTLLKVIKEELVECEETTIPPPISSVPQCYADNLLQDLRELSSEDSSPESVNSDEDLMTTGDESSKVVGGKTRKKSLKKKKVNSGKKSCTIVSSDDDINKLCELDSLNRKKKNKNYEIPSKNNESSSVSKKKRKMTVKDSSDTTDSDLEDSVAGSPEKDYSNDMDWENMDQNDPLTDKAYDALKYLQNSTDDEEMDLSQSPNEQKTKNNIKRKNKGGQKEKKKLTLEEKKKKEWMKDPLLRGKLTSSDSDVEFIQIKPKEKTNKKREPQEECAETPPTKRRRLKSESSSDDEFIEEVCMTTDSPKKGRRNIRALMNDKDLTESTQRANCEERERVERIKKIEKKTTELSQSNKSAVILDADDDGNWIQVDPILAKRLKPHQVKGVKFMWNSCYESISRLKINEGGGCILAHCMGLGKTRQVITLLHTLFSHKSVPIQHALVVCPMSTVSNWDNEMNLSLKDVDNIPFSSFSICKQKDKLRKKLIVETWWNRCGILVISYDTYESLTRDSALSKLDEGTRKILIEALTDPGPDLLICDEGHLLRTDQSLRSIALNKVKTKRRIVLTGTPMQNNLLEYYQMVNFVKPNLLGTLNEFKTNFVNPIRNGQYDDSTTEDCRLMKKRTHVLNQLLKETVQRMESNVLEKYLPNILDYAVFIKLGPLQAELYHSFINLRIKKPTLFGDYPLLSRLTTHPYVMKIDEQKKHSKMPRERDVIETDDYGNQTTLKELDIWYNSLPNVIETNYEIGGKLYIMKAIIEACEKLNDKLLIFSNHLTEMDCIEYFLKNRGTNGCASWIPGKDYCRMDGTVLPEERASLCNKFNDENNKRLRVFLLSHRVGGLGLNLTAANRVILLGVSFNPSYDIQCVYRAYRFGQKKRVFVYRLMGLGTMEEKVYQRSITKLAVSSRVLDKHQITRHYKSVELQEIYNVNLRQDESRPMPNVPEDKLLANLISKHECIFKFHEHRGLLINRPEEDLNESEKALAWEEFHRINEVPSGDSHVTMVREIQKGVLNESTKQPLQKQPVSSTKNLKAATQEPFKVACGRKNKPVATITTSEITKEKSENIIQGSQNDEIIILDDPPNSPPDIDNTTVVINDDDDCVIVSPPSAVANDTPSPSIEQRIVKAIKEYQGLTVTELPRRSLQ